MPENGVPKRYRALLEAMPQGALVYDANGVIVEANTAAARLVGADLEQLVGYDARAGDWPAWAEDGSELRWEDRPAAITLATGEAVRDFVFGVRRHDDGERRWIRTNTQPVLDDEGTVAAVVAAISDVTEERARGRELAHSRERLSAIFNASPPAIITVDMDGHVTSWSPSAERIFGWREEEVLGEFNPTVSDEMRGFYANALREWDHRGDAPPEEVQVRRKDGSTVDIAISVAPLFEDGRQIGCVGIMEDISARRAAEEREREQRARLEAILDASPFAIITIDLDGTVTSWNSGAEELFGWTAEEAVGRYHPAILPEKRPLLNEILREIEGGGQSVVSETFALHKDGTRIPVQGAIAALRDPAGEMYGAVGIHQDVTERREAEQRLRESRARYRDLFENSPVAIWELDLSDTLPALEMLDATSVQDYAEAFKRRKDLLRDCIAEISTLDVNQAVLNLHDMSDPDQLREDYWKLIPDEGATTIGHGLALLATGWQVFDLTVPLRAADGEVLQLLARVQVAPGHEERLDRVLVSALDVTDLEKAREELQQANQLLEATLAGMDQAVIAATPQGHIISCNEAAGATFDVEPGESVRRLFPSEDEYERSRRAARRVLAEGDTYEEELLLVRADGTEFLAELLCSPLNPARGWLDGSVMVIRDVTEEREMQERLAQSRRLEAVGQLAGGVAHDFNNMLTVIVGNLQLALRGMDESETVRKQVSQSLDAARRTAKLTNQLLAFSRKQVLAPEALDIDDAVRELGELLRRTIPESIDLQINTDADATVYFDPAQVDQIVMNLVVNARDAMAEGGTLTIETRSVRVEDQQQPPVEVTPGEYVRLTVSDTGVGMDEEKLSRIFEPFFSTKEEGQGTGLGLATVYGIVRQGGGDITVCSEPGEGTCFTVYFPTTEEPAAEDAPRRRDRSVTASRETVLVVEDDAAVRRLVVSVLRANGYDVLATCSGAEAQRLFNENSETVRLLVTDVVMPGMSGAQLAGRLRRSRPDLPVLYISGYTEGVVDDQGPDDAGARLLSKPFGPDDLLAEVRRALNDRGE